MRLPRMGFLGQNAMGAAALTALRDAGAAPDLVMTRPPSDHENAVEEAADDVACDVVDPLAPEAIETRISNYALELVICCGWSQRIPTGLLELPVHGWWNLHPSRLPAWRGSNPIGWQLLTGRRRLGYSVHEMDEGYDTGAVLTRGHVDVPAGCDGGTARTVVGAAMGAAAAGLVHAAGRCAPSRSLQEADLATHCPPNGVLALLDPARLTRRQAAAAVLAFAPFPGVGVLGLPPRRLAVATDEPDADRPPSDGLLAVDVRFADGPLTLWCRLA